LSRGRVRVLSLEPVGRIGVVIGQFKPVAEFIAETIPPPDAAVSIATRSVSALWDPDSAD